MRKKREEVTSNGIILLVDDEPGIVNSLRTLIEMDNYTVLGYTDIDKAWNQIEDGLKYDTAVIDLLIRSNRESDKNFTGVDLIQMAKTLNPDRRIIAMTGEIEEIRTLADYTLIKSFKYPELRKLLPNAYRPRPMDEMYR